MKRKPKQKPLTVTALDRIRLNINVVAKDDFLGPCVGVMVSFGCDVLGKYTDVKINDKVLRFHPARVSRL